jgi:DNA-binding MarR family transcriptional regulator
MPAKRPLAGGSKDLPPAAPDRSPPNVGFLLSQLGFAASRRFMEALEPLGIHPREFLLLRFVASSEGQSQQALAKRLDVPASRMVAVVDGLEASGLVERRPDPDDRRVRALYQTKKGRELLARAIEIAGEYEASVCSGLEQEEHAQLIGLLRKLQPGLVQLPGVHPGFAAGEPESSDG